MAKEKNKHPERGTYCDRCGKLTSMDNRKLLRFTKYVRTPEKYPVTSSNHSIKVYKGYGLCLECTEIIEKILEKEIIK